MWDAKHLQMGAEVWLKMPRRQLVEILAGCERKKLDHLFQ